MAYKPDLSDIFIKALDALAANPEIIPLGVFGGSGLGRTCRSTCDGTGRDDSTADVGGFGAVNIYEYDKYYCVEFDVPGTTKADIKLDLVNMQNDYILKMSAKRIEPKKKPRLNTLNAVLRQEQFSGTKTREIALSNIAPDTMTASHQDGVLSVFVNKKDGDKQVSKSIPIS